MSIILKYQKRYEDQLIKLIEEGHKLAEEKIHLEGVEKEGKLYGYDQDPQYQLDIALTPYHHNDLSYAILKWQTQCRHLTEKILALENRDCFQGIALIKKKKLEGHQIQEITSDLDAILEDIKAGLFGNIFIAAEAHSVLNHIEQAQDEFDEGNYSIAALIALSSIESFLKELARNSAISSGSKIPRGMKPLANFLASKNSRYELNKKSKDKIYRWAEVRNDVSHDFLQPVNELEIRDLLIEIKSFAELSYQD